MTRATRSGMLLVDKPVGLTSHQVVAWARRVFEMRRVGHAGTLDPLASGLLPVMLGTATRLVRFMHEWPKTYVGLVRLGIETATGDAEGAPAFVAPVPLPPAAVLDRARHRLTGIYLQEPPAFSAKKIGGVPAHRLARRGHSPALLPARVTVHALRIKPAGEGRIAFAARVSSGTYIRSLARDLGRLVGTGAYLESLRRTGIGPLRVRGAVAPARDASGPDLTAALMTPDRIPLPLPTVCVPAEDAPRFSSGHGFDAAPAPGECGTYVRVLLEDGRLAGVGELTAEERVQPRVVLETA